jgi:hypothetical protein
MTDPYRRGPGQGEPYPYGNPGYSDPAYGAQVPYGQPYQAPHVPNPTQQLPTYEYGYDPYATGAYGQPRPPDEPPPPEPPSRKWLWVLATIALLTVLGLVIAVVVIDSASQQTVVQPPPTLQTSQPSSPPTTSRTPTTTPTRPSITIPLPTLPNPTVPTVPGTPSTPAGPPQTVVYDVGGTGRAISITYVADGGILQTEFNVMLPWTKQVELSNADTMASVNIINFGREITCSITVAGAQVESNTSAGLTICGALR